MQWQHGCLAHMQGMKDEEVDFPFRVLPTEQRIIELVPPSSIVLLGRSGTGKTTCAVFRMYGAWLAHHSDPEAPPHNMVRAAGPPHDEYCARHPA